MSDRRVKHLYEYVADAIRLLNARIFGDIMIGSTAAIAASVVFQYYVEDRAYRTELSKFQNSMRIIEGYCKLYSGWYRPDSQSADAFEIHRIPGLPDPIVEGAIESLRFIGERDVDAYQAMRHMSQIYKRDLLNYIYNDDTVRQWRAHRYYRSFDYVCAWTGVKTNIMCSGSRTVVLRETGPAMTYYYGSDGGEVMSCDSQAIYDSYTFPTIE